MSSRFQPKSCSFPLASALLLAGLCSSASAVTTSVSVSTIPVGYLKSTFNSGTTAAFGLPLDDTSALPVGIRAGRIESFTATTITQSAGGWTGNLANPAAPWAVRLTSGAAAGKMFDVSSNSTTTLTLNGATLSTAGVAIGDTFELVSLDTLGTLFGAGTFQGGTSSANADVVQLRSGATWIAFFYDTSLGFWHRTSGVATNSDNTIIRPGSGLMLTRRGATLTLTFTGRVLGTTFRMPVNNASTTGLTTGYPMDTTLGGLGLQNLLTGWRSGTSTSTADSIGLYNGTAWVPYVFNGANWQTTTGINSDAAALPAGGMLLIQRPGSTPGTTDLVRNQPY